MWMLGLKDLFVLMMRMAIELMSHALGKLSSWLLEQDSPDSLGLLNLHLNFQPRLADCFHRENSCCVVLGKQKMIAK